MSYRDTCPQRTVTTVHHTIATWLPVRLDCGHVEEINWTTREGAKIGCTHCQRAIVEDRINNTNPAAPNAWDWLDDAATR